MDPQACWDELFGRFKDQDYYPNYYMDDRDREVELLRALADWIEKGGFRPKVRE